MASPSVVASTTQRLSRSFTETLAAHKKFPWVAHWWTEHLLGLSLGSSPLTLRLSKGERALGRMFRSCRG